MASKLSPFFFGFAAGGGAGSVAGTVADSVTGDADAEADAEADADTEADGVGVVAVPSKPRSVEDVAYNFIVSCRR